MTIEASYDDKTIKRENENVIVFCKECNTEYHINFGATGMTCCGKFISSTKEKNK